MGKAAQLGIHPQFIKVGRGSAKLVHHGLAGNLYRFFLRDVPRAGQPVHLLIRAQSAGLDQQLGVGSLLLQRPAGQRAALGLQDGDRGHHILPDAVFLGHQAGGDFLLLLVGGALVLKLRNLRGVKVDAFLLHTQHKVCPLLAGPGIKVANGSFIFCNLLVVVLPQGGGHCRSGHQGQRDGQHQSKRQSLLHGGFSSHLPEQLVRLLRRPVQLGKLAVEDGLDVTLHRNTTFPASLTVCFSPGSGGI